MMQSIEQEHTTGSAALALAPTSAQGDGQPPAIHRTPPDRTRKRLLARGDLYLRVLAFVMLAYALVGKKAAYVGLAPVYNAEIMLGWGIWILLEGGGLLRVLNSAPAVLLMTFMAWGAIRTVPYVSEYRIDALRDSVIYMYGLFALVMAGVLIQSPRRLIALLTWYPKFIWLLFFVGTPILMLSLFWYIAWTLPGGWLMVTYLDGNKGGDFIVHVAGAFAFLTLLSGAMAPTPKTPPGRKKPLKVVFVEWAPTIMIVIDLGLTMSVRAATLSFLISASITTLAMFALPRKVRGGVPSKLVLVVVAGVAALAVSQIHVPLNEGREMSFKQLSENFKSVAGFGDPQAEVLDATKKWRLEWWNEIINYTLHGKYFWTGKGFGINLANADGFQVNTDGSLRSPHNGHLTILARSGVPGFTLWVLLNLTWAGAMIDGFFRARNARQTQWAGLFIFLLAYWAAYLTNASFNVFLEGPVGGVWFWLIFGAGLGVQRLYRECPSLLAGPPYPQPIALLRGAGRRPATGASAA